MSGQASDETVSGIACDLTGTITAYGVGAERLFGWKPEELIGKEKVTIFHQKQKVGILVPRLLRTATSRGIFKEEVTLVRKDGSEFRAILTVRPLEKEGRIVGYMGVTKPLPPEQAITPRKPSLLQTWWQELRAPFLLLPLIFVPTGVALAWLHGAFNPVYAVLTLIGVVALHASVNVLNDYFDYRSGIDLLTTPTPFSGGSRILPEGLLAPSSVLLGGNLFLALGTAIGLYFLYTFAFDPVLLLLLAISVLSVTGYSKLASWGVGEFFVGLNFGPLLVLGTYYVQTRQITWAPILAGTTLGLLTAAILYINQFPDFEADKAKGRFHLVVRLGKPTAARVFKYLLASAYGIIVLGVLLRILPFYTLLTLLTIPRARYAVQTLEREYDKLLELIPGMAATVLTTLHTGVLLLVGLILGGLLPPLPF